MLAVVEDPLRSALAKYGERIHLKPGTVLLDHGKPSTGIYLLLSGAVETCLPTRNQPLFRKAPIGSILGVPATINESQYSISAVVVEDSELIHVSRLQLLELIRTDPAVSLPIIELLSAELLEMRQQLKVPRGSFSTLVH